MTARPRVKPTKLTASYSATLDDNLREVTRGRWRSMRTLRRNIYQANASIQILSSLGARYPEEVTPAILAKFREKSLGCCSPATLNVRLSVMSALGVNVSSARQGYTPPRKWYLRPEDEERLGSCPGLLSVTRAFIAWTCATGLRVEESLRLTWRDVALGEGVVDVPGTKTLGSAARLPLSEEARAVLGACMRQPDVDPSAAVFPISYRALRQQWETARAFLGYSGVPTATLKSLRRSFARRAHLKGMPADVLRQYLRHSSLRTTMGYLHLVGGYSHDEMRRWL